VGTQIRNKPDTYSRNWQQQVGTQIRNKPDTYSRLLAAAGGHTNEKQTGYLLSDIGSNGWAHKLETHLIPTLEYWQQQVGTQIRNKSDTYSRILAATGEHTN
jgi:hypothetical protein